jgi:hypothetical protein
MAGFSYFNNSETLVAVRFSTDGIPVALSPHLAKLRPLCLLADCARAETRYVAAALNP